MSEETSESREHAICPACGYDLFGLPVDRHVVRCPECGLRFDLRLLLTPPDERARKLRGMESLPAFAIGPSVGAVFVLWFAIDAREAVPESWGLFMVCLILALAGIAAATVFIRRYRYVVGAKDVLVLFGACSFSFLVGVPMFLCGVLVAPAQLGRGSYELGVLLPVLGAAALVLFWVLYRRARRVLGSMHDQLVGRVPDRGRVEQRAEQETMER